MRDIQTPIQLLRGLFLNREVVRGGAVRDVHVARHPPPLQQRFCRLHFVPVQEQRLRPGVKLVSRRSVVPCEQRVHALLVVARYAVAPPPLCHPLRPNLNQRLPASERLALLPRIPLRLSLRLLRARDRDDLTLMRVSLLPLPPSLSLRLLLPPRLSRTLLLRLSVSVRVTGRPAQVFWGVQGLGFRV